MAMRKVFYSFHFDNDCWRTGQVRNIGVIEGNSTVSDHDWEKVKKGGDAAIQKWIDNQLYGRSCTVVLVGEKTRGRKWIKYEIEKSWNDGKGVVGICIHNLLNQDGNSSEIGANPFGDFTIKSNGEKLSDIVNLYNPPYKISINVYKYISENISSWVEEAIEIRKSYKS